MIFNPQIWWMCLRYMYECLKYLRRMQRRDFHDAILQTGATLFNLLNVMQNLWQTFRLMLRVKRNRINRTNPHKLIQLLQGYRAHYRTHDVWTLLQNNWADFFWLTGEIPPTLDQLVRKIQPIYTNMFHMRRGLVDFRNQTLLTMIWLRKYPTMSQLASQFGISIPCVHKIIHRIVPVLHSYLVPKYIRWHSMDHWRRLCGTFPEWPRVVAIIDGTPFRISRPKGCYQRLFWRGDRHCFFLNWIVIVDVNGYIVFSRPGFTGHLHDSTCLGYINLPVLPPGLQIMADQGFANVRPFLVPLPRHGFHLHPRLRRSFRSRRCLIERCFGILKSSYTAVGSRRYRSNRSWSPIICNTCTSLFNRRKLFFKRLRQMFA